MTLSRALRRRRRRRTTPPIPRALWARSLRSTATATGKAFGADAFIRRYFTPEFKASWDHAMAQPEDVLDGDPITGAQALKSVKLDGVQVAAKTSNSASVVTKLAVTPRGAETYSQAVTFTLKRDGRGWKIDDISGPVDGSLRGYFRKNYGQ